MKFEKEVTVKVGSSYEKLYEQLLAKNFKVVEEYRLIDTYMLPKQVDLYRGEVLEILKQCVLIRDVVGITKKIVYKYKEYDEDKNIIKQGKTECEILDTNKAMDLMKAIGYRELFQIADDCTVFTDGKIELTVQQVNDRYVFIELENSSKHTGQAFQTIGEMIRALEEVGLPYDKGNYFVKKAEILFADTYS